MSELRAQVTETEGSGSGVVDYNGSSPLHTRNYLIDTAGMSNAQVVEYYNVWADNYDKELSPDVYNGPVIATNAMANHYSSESSRATIKILDVAAGTGLVGRELHKLGFKNIDALEPSSGMLNILKGRNIYGECFETPIDSTQIPTILPNAYECIVIAGGMGQGLIPVNALDEMIRIVKSGGMIFIVMREEYLTKLKDYDNKLEPYMKELEDKGLWKQIGRDVVDNYSFGNKGVVFQYESPLSLNLNLRVHCTIKAHTGN